MTDVILLAAGNSRRFLAGTEKKNKLLSLFRGRPLYTYGLDAWKQGSRNKNCRVFVVAREREILEAAAERGFVPVESPESEKGISWSIRAGLQAAGEGGDHLVFGAADQPFLRPETLERFLTEAEKGKYACLSWKGELFNPVSFPREAVRELGELKGDEGGKRVLRRHLAECFLVEASSEAETADVDTWEDLKILEEFDAIYQPDHTDL